MLRVVVGLCVFSFVNFVYAQEKAQDNGKKQADLPSLLLQQTKNNNAVTANAPLKDQVKTNVINKSISDDKKTEQKTTTNDVKISENKEINIKPEPSVQSVASNTTVNTDIKNDNTNAVKNSDVVELQLLMKKDTSYKVFQLINPTRLVVDVFDSSVKIDYDNKSLQGTCVKEIRTAYHDQNKYRVVLDLNKEVKFETQEKDSNSESEGKDLHKTLIIKLTPKSKN